MTAMVQLIRRHTQAMPPKIPGTSRRAAAVTAITDLLSTGWVMNPLVRKAHPAPIQRQTQQRQDLSAAGAQWLGWDAWVAFKPIEHRNYKAEIHHEGLPNHP